MASNSDDDDVSIPSRYRDVLLDALQASTRRKLSLYLNIERLLNEDGIEPDYNGLAKQIGFSFLEIQNFGRQKDPTTEVLNEWTRRPDLSPTVGQLFYYLRVMGREDVMTDCKRSIILDIEHHVSQEERRQNDVVPLQNDTMSKSSTPKSSDFTAHDTNENRSMTVQDVESNTPTFYDAFVCSDPEGYDLQFVKKMLSELESARYGLKLFVPWMDGLRWSAVSAKVIHDRCRKMVIIMSPRFLKSPAFDFQTKFALSLSPDCLRKKLVPVLITPCIIPQNLRHITLCDFTKLAFMEWYWHRLAVAIKAPLSFDELQINDKTSLEDITLSLDQEQYHNSGSSINSSQPLPIIHSSSSSSSSSARPAAAAANSPGSSSSMEVGPPVQSAPQGTSTLPSKQASRHCSPTS
ncbi:myeloid differentiation primary response protein MyD88-like [Haliotis rubra]|uniref:myeloid differentiation primary response protein MyD88-like n=1 Tax=Haliotis rubra TaxID=36100 RepID=UPI001EE56375|nr:myeloid differentiation primary response protein MyD88-like [Haliotis rubra]XP_046570296.1 myeloid differentiation primary response protein MyD88-like [Haliotis rubra]